MSRTPLEGYISHAEHDVEFYGKKLESELKWLEGNIRDRPTPAPYPCRVFRSPASPPTSPGPQTPGEHQMSETPEMTAGADTLAWEVFRADNSNATEDILRADFPAKAEYALNIAKHLRAAGYRRPRTITTVEELDALPTGSVIVTFGKGQRVGKIKKASDGKMIVWAIIGDNIAGMNSLVMTDAIPATVIYEPQP